MIFRRLILGAVISASAAVSAFGAGVTFSTFTDPHSIPGLGGTIGFAFAGDKFVGSVQGDGTGQLYSTDLTGGSVQLFAPTANLLPTASSEHYVASSLGLGGFPNRDVYVASGNGVLHISNDGSTSNSFVTGLNGTVRGIAFDAVGTFGGDMLITTTSGNVYRVNSAGGVTGLASLGADTEGLDVAPLGAGFGVYDGQLITASEGTGLLHAISAAGVVTTLNPTNPLPGEIEELDFVPLNLGASGNPVEGFYGANYTQNVIKAGASQFAGKEGHIILTQEGSGGVLEVFFSGTTLTSQTIGNFPNQPEDGIFVTAAIVQGAAPEPSTVFTLGAGLLGMAVVMYRRRSARQRRYSSTI